MDVEDLRRAVQRLTTRVGHWQAARWAADGRADRVHALVQRLADLAADVEGGPHRPVPRVGDLVLPDQLRVVADDLVYAAEADVGAKLDAGAEGAVAATAEVIRRAVTDVDAADRSL